MPAASELTRIEARAYTIPTETPEADGTLSWDSTTLVLVKLSTAAETGIGYTYSAAAAADLVRDEFAERLAGCDAFDIRGTRERLLVAARNLGRAGLVATAISAVDIALWDLKAKLLHVPLAKLLGKVRDSVRIYGSGGFTSDPDNTVAAECRQWADEGISAVKIKVGAGVREGDARVKSVRRAIGPDVELFVDANGACDTKGALTLAGRLAGHDVRWLEEPVSSDDLEGLALLVKRVPAPLEIAAGEYGYNSDYFRRMLATGSVDVLQADATRCLGITGFMDAAALAEAAHVPLSSHTAPSVHLQACCAALPLRHMEFFKDHVRIERMLFDGFREPVDGRVAPDPERPGLGLTFRDSSALRYAA